ncbi:MAG TPA: radical SAM protein [Acidimicrobiia bacterium]|nr:radical SAM protein [Acidimicrobiia bacterium]
MTAGMPVREDRILRYVNAFCPHCHEEAPHRPLEEVRRLSGYLSEAEGQVWLVRGCPEHGKVITLYDEDPEILAYLEQWTAPTKVHIPDTPGNFAPLPAAYLEGLGEMQTQHTCILLEDINENCNLKCPTCYADSTPRLTGVASVRQVMDSIDQRLTREGGRIDVLMLSGGEPTIHPRFGEILESALERNVVRILVNSNGVTIARDDHLVSLLAQNRDRVEVYLQFDGFRRETYLHHRAVDLRSIKQLAIQRLSDSGVFTTLTMTAALGVNDDEIGAVVLHALETPYVGGVSIQPQFGSGRSGPINPLQRLTHTGVLKRLGPQTDGVVQWNDLTALPCSHPHCASVGYMLRDDDGDWKSLAAVIGHERLKAHLDVVSNKIIDPELTTELRELVKASLLGLLSEQTSLSHPTVLDLFRDVCEACDLGLSTLLKMAAGTRRQSAVLREMVGTRIKRITVKPFMDMNTMLEERLMQCCVHVGTKTAEQNQCAPFCAVQAWRPLGEMKIAEIARRGSERNTIPLAVSR